MTTQNDFELNENNAAEADVKPAEHFAAVATAMNTYPHLFDVKVDPGFSFDGQSFGYMGENNLPILSRPRGENAMSEEQIRISKIEGLACGLLATIKPENLKTPELLNQKDMQLFRNIRERFITGHPHIIAYIESRTLSTELAQLIEDPDIKAEVMAFIDVILKEHLDSGSAELPWLMFKKNVVNEAEGVNKVQVGTRTFSVSLNDESNPVIEKVSAIGKREDAVTEFMDVISVKPLIAEIAVINDVPVSEVVKNVKKILVGYTLFEYYWEHPDLWQSEGVQYFEKQEEEIKDEVAAVLQKINTYKQMEAFKDPVATAEFYENFLDEFHRELIRTGAFIFFADELGPNPFSSEDFKKYLASVKPEGEHDVFDVLAYMIETQTFWANVKLPSIPKPEEIKIKKAKGNEQAATSKKKEKNKISHSLSHDQLGLPEHVRLSGVIGMSHLLHQTENGTEGRVRYGLAGIESMDGFEGTYIYGTTDFANPVEMIMARIAAGNAPREKVIYFSDQNAHSVGSYMKRILIPTLMSMYDMSPEEQAALSAMAAKYSGNMDVLLSNMMSGGSASLQSYFHDIQSKIGSCASFSEIYIKMNQHLANKIGVTYTTASDFLSETDFKVSDFMDYVEKIKPMVNQSITTFRMELENKIRDAYTDIDETALAETLNMYMRNTIGDISEWDLADRLFIKPVHGNNAFDFEAIADLKLSEVSKSGYTFGGNAWVIIMQMMENHFPDGIAVAHKATRQGANYVLPITAATNTMIVASPITRCVPDSGNAKTGDGLDIGMYIRNEDLVEAVGDEMYKALSNPSLAGGTDQRVIRVGTQKVFVNGRGQPKAKNGLKLSMGTQAIEGGSMGSKRIDYLF